MNGRVIAQRATTRIYRSGRTLAALTGLALMAGSVLPAAASLDHYWTLDTDAYSWTGGWGPHTGYEDTGAAGAKLHLWIENGTLDGTGQLLGGGAANFTGDATSQLRGEDDNPATLTPSVITFAVWVKRTGNWTDFEHVFAAAKNWANWDGDGWWMASWDYGNSIVVCLSGNQMFKYDAGAQIFAQDTWVHVAMTFNSTTKARAMYINGSPVATTVPVGNSTPDFITPTTPEFRLGHNMYWTGASLALGELDDAGIWNEELSATRVKALYNLANTGALAYGQKTSAALFSGFDTGTVDDGVADVTVGAMKWFKVSAGIGGSDGDVVALAGGGYALNLGGGAGMTGQVYIASLDHYWTLDTDTYGFTAWGNPYTGYQDTGAAGSKVDLFAVDVTLGTTSQKLGGGAANFNIGANSQLRRDDDNPATLMPNVVTFTAWVKRTGDWGTAERMIVNAKDWGNYQANGWYLTTWNGGASIQVVLSGNQSFQHDAGAQIFPLDAWVHVAMTFNSDTDARAIYINGSPVTTFVPNGWSVPNAITPTNPEFRLGLNMYGGSSLVPGELDDVGIWNGELDAAAVRALYSLGNNATLRYDAATVRSLLAAYQAGTADDETPEIVISGVPWLKVSSGLGGSEGDVVALTALNWGLNLDNGAGMRTKIRKGTMIMVF